MEDTRTQIKYQQLTQTGFETDWHVAPWGSTSWLTVENDNAHPPTAEEFFQKDDRAPNTLYLSVNYERCIANPAGLALWKPQAANVETVLLRRGDTIIIPPGAVHKFVNVTDIFCTGGLFMEREILYICIGLAREQRLYPYPKLLNYQNELRLTVEKWLSRITFSFAPRHVLLNQLRFDEKPPF